MFVCGFTKRKNLFCNDECRHYKTCTRKNRFLLKDDKPRGRNNGKK